MSCGGPSPPSLDVIDAVSAPAIAENWFRIAAMTPRSGAATVSLLGVLWGCSASQEEAGAVTAIFPDVAYNDVPLTVEIDGTRFRPAYGFDTMSATTAAEDGDFSVTLVSIAGDSPMPDSRALESVVWKTPTELGATIPADVPAGAYDVVVTDPRGWSGTLHQAFTSLGPDAEAPVLAINSPQPRGLIGALTTISVVVSSDDGHGFVERMDVTVSTAATAATPTRKECRGTPAHKKTCQLEFPAPVPADENDMLQIVARAADTVGNETPPLTINLRLAPRPQLIDLTPSEGPTGGGTALVVKGKNFVVETGDSDGSQLLIDGVRIPATVVSPTEITALTLPHDARIAMVQVTTGGARSPARPFEFVAPPGVRRVEPCRGPVAGGTWIIVAGNHFRDGPTTIYVGGQPLLEPVFVGVNRIEGRVPAASAPGEAAVTALDPVGGPGTMAGTFVYDAEETQPYPPGGGLATLLCAGVQ